MSPHCDRISAESGQFCSSLDDRCVFFPHLGPPPPRPISAPLPREQPGRAEEWDSWRCEWTAVKLLEAAAHAEFLFLQAPTLNLGFCSLMAPSFNPLKLSSDVCRSQVSKLSGEAETSGSAFMECFWHDVVRKRRNTNSEGNTGSEDWVCSVSSGLFRRFPPWFKCCTSPFLHHKVLQKV